MLLGNFMSIAQLIVYVLSRERDMRRLSLSVYSERGRWPELKMERLPAALMTVNLKREREV